MAFNRAPTVDTYSADRVSLFREIALRDGGASGKDEDYVNVFMEIVKQGKANDQRRFIMKRAGSSQVLASVAASNVRGMFYWADQSKLYYSVGRNVYVYNVDTAVTTTLSNVFATSTGNVGFCEFLYTNGSVKIIASDGSAVSGLISIDTANTVATSSDVDLPAHLPNPIFLDGYLFIARKNSAEIWNSVINDPFSWDPVTFITTEMEADLIVDLVKLNNYLVAFGKETIEYFWDAANVAPDSPLQRNDTPIKINQYLAGLSKYGNQVYYIGKDAGGQPDVFMMKDFQVKSIASNSITRYLTDSSSNIDTWTGNVVSFQGHTFYLINAGSNKTWLIDLDTELATRIAYQKGATFPMLQSLTISGNTNRSFFTLNNSSSAIYVFNGSVYQDNGVNFTCTLTTEGNDFGTMNRKTMSRFAIMGDRPPANSNLTIQWSDDDFQTLNAGVDVNMNQDLPSVRQLGSFRQRIFKLSYTDNFPLRIQDIEVTINKGAS